MVVPAPPPAEAADHSSGTPQGWPDLLWRVLGDHRRAAWCLAFTLVFVGTFLTTVWLVSPHLGTLATSAVGALGGGAAVGAVGGIRTAVRARRTRYGG